jgi:hypothetical protein
MNMLSTWIKEVEQIISTNYGYRIYTDINHGFYFDLFIKDHRCITMNNETLIDDINISLLLSDLKLLSE